MFCIFADDTVSLVVPCESGGYIVGVGLSLCHLDWDTKEITTLASVEPGSGNRFNDGKCDVSGRLWAGIYVYVFMYVLFSNTGT
jgi:gluconolactonase